MHKITPAEEAYAIGYTYGLANDKRGLIVKKQERGYCDSDYLQKELDRGFTNGELSRLTKEVERDTLEAGSKRERPKPLTKEQQKEKEIEALIIVGVTRESAYEIVERRHLRQQISWLDHHSSIKDVRNVLLRAFPPLENTL